MIDRQRTQSPSAHRPLHRNLSLARALIAGAGLGISFLMGCTLDFSEFEPYTTPEGYGGTPVPDMVVVMDMGPMVDMEEVADMIIDMDLPPDRDGDGVIDDEDNCPDVVNPDQLDGDGDMIGDLCDDGDGDGIFDYIPDGQGGSVPYDNCPDISNPDQRDSDWDQIGDVCDPDIDGDGLERAQELERGTDPNLADSDQDGFTDSDDLCPLVPSRGLDSDGDGIGNACDRDDDNDGILDWMDACPFHSDPEQEVTTETGGFGRGVACATDFDADGIEDGTDPCPLVPADADGGHTACQTSDIFSGFDADVYDLKSAGGFIWSASTGGLSRFLLDEPKLQDAPELKLNTNVGLWSAETHHVDTLSSAGPNRLFIRGVWVVSGGRLAALRYDGITEKYWAIEQDLSDLGVTQINDVIGYQEGAIVATAEGLYSVSYNGVTELPLEMPLTPNVTALYYDAALGEVWFAVGNNLFKLALSESTITLITELPDVNEVRSIRTGAPSSPHSPSTLILVTDSDVIFYSTTDNIEAYPRISISAYDVIARSFGLYIAGDSGLVWGAPESEFSLPAINAVQGVKVRALVESPYGLVIGSASQGQGSAHPGGLGDEGGIRSGGGVWTRRVIDGEDCVIETLVNTRGDLWIATSTGLYKRDSAGVQTLVIEEPIYDIYSDGTNLWVATQTGLSRVLFEGGEVADSYAPPTLTPPFTAVHKINNRLWVGAQDGIAYSELDPASTPQVWSEFLSAQEAYLRPGEVIGFGYDGQTTWIAVRGADGGISRYNDSGFNPVVYSQTNALIPSNLITGFNVNATRVVVTTESGVSILKPNIQNVNDIETLYVGQGIPNAAGTSKVLSVADTGDRLWLFTETTGSNPYGGLVSMEVDGPQAPLHTPGSERFYGGHDVDVLKSALPEILGERQRARLSVTYPTGADPMVTLSTCGDIASPGLIGLLDDTSMLESTITARGLPGAREGVLVPSPRGHAMFATVFGRLEAESDEDYGPGETRFVDLYPPLPEGEEWPEGSEPRRVSVDADSLSRPIKDCRAFVQENEPVKRMICLLEGNYLAQHIRNTWSVNDPPGLLEGNVTVRDFILDPDNPSNEMWFATDQGLVNVRNGQSKKLSVMNTNQGLPSDDVTSLALNAQLQILYVGTSKGVVSLNIASGIPEDTTLTEWTEIAPASRLMRGAITALKFDTATGALWVGSYGGAARVLNDELITYPQGSSLPAAPVSSIAITGDRVFFAHESGVSVLSGPDWSHYGARAGVSEITGRLVVDDSGAIWALTPHGAVGFRSSGQE